MVRTAVMRNLYHVMNVQFSVIFSLLGARLHNKRRLNAQHIIKADARKGWTNIYVMSTTSSNVRTAAGLISGVLGLAVIIYLTVLLTCGSLVEWRRTTWGRITTWWKHDNTQYPDQSHRVTQV